MQQTFLVNLLNEIFDIVKDLSTKYELTKTINCDENLYDVEIKNRIQQKILNVPNKYSAVSYVNNIMRIKSLGDVEILNGTEVERVGYFNSVDGFALEKQKQMMPVKRFYRIGTTEVNI